MIATIAALVVTVLMGGIIAYNGDVIGRRFGKRRVSVFGLRPKHTAILITSITGVLISGLTTGFLFLAVSPVRDVILRGEWAIRTRAKAMADLHDAQHALRTTQASLDFTNRQLSLKQTELNDAARREKEVERIGAELAAKNTTLAQQNLELASKNEALKRERTLLTDFTKKQRDINAKSVAENERLTAENRALAAETQGMKSAGTEAIARLERLRSHRIVIHTGEELARVVMPARCTAQRARAILGELMQKASAAALTRGAATEGRPRAVKVATKRFIDTQGSAPTITEVTEQDRINALVDPEKPVTKWSPVRLVGWAHPVCVLALAVGNSAEQEQATIDFQPFENREVYKKGQVVGTKDINADESPDRVFLSLVGFLKSIGQDALKAGMIPHLDPITGESQVGSFGLPDMVKLQDQVRSHGGRVRITAAVGADTSASDTLGLHFTLARVP